MLIPIMNSFIRTNGITINLSGVKCIKSLSVDIPGHFKAVPCKYTVKFIQKIIINARLRHYFKQIIISKDESSTCITHYYLRRWRSELCKFWSWTTLEMSREVVRDNVVTYSQLWKISNCFGGILQVSLRHFNTPEQQSFPVGYPVYFPAVLAQADHVGFTSWVMQVQL